MPTPPPRKPWPIRRRLQHVSTLPIARFMAIGAVSTLAYALLFLLLAGPLGSSSANLVSLILTALANTAVNRRLTFGVRGRDDLMRHHLGGLAMFAVQLGMTDGSLALLHSADAHPGRPLELTVLLIASLCATLTRYFALSSFVFRADHRFHPHVRFAPDQR